MHDRQFPDLGVGLGLRPELEEFAESSDLVDWIEVISEHYMDNPDAVDELAGHFAGKTVIPHGIEMSIGTVGNDREWREYVDSLSVLVNTLDAPWFSDHLCFTKTSAHTEIASLTPLPCTREAVTHVVERVKVVQRVVGRPFLLENIAYHFSWGGRELTEPEFIRRIIEESECYLLLDLTNLAYNAENHGFEPEEFLAGLPLDRVVQVHLAGGTHGADGAVYDTHSEPVPSRVWNLLRGLLSTTRVSGVMIERDSRLDELTEVTDDLRKARHIVEGAAAQWTPGHKN